MKPETINSQNLIFFVKTKYAKKTIGKKINKNEGL